MDHIEQSGNVLGSPVKVGGVAIKLNVDFLQFYQLLLSSFLEAQHQSNMTEVKA